MGASNISNLYLEHGSITPLYLYPGVSFKRWKLPLLTRCVCLLLLCSIFFDNIQRRFCSPDALGFILYPKKCVKNDQDEDKKFQKNTRSDMKIQKYSSIQVYKYISILVIKYSIQVFKYSSILVFKYSSLV